MPRDKYISRATGCAATICKSRKGDSAACANCATQVFGPAFSQKAGRVLRGKAPKSPSAEGETPPMIPKRSGREDQRPGGTLVRGEPYQGVPRRTQSYKKRTNKTAPARRNAETFQLAGAVLRSGQIRSASCRNFEEIAAAGTSAGGLRAAFPSFWVAPEAQRVGFRFLRKARRAPPSTCQPFSKGWTENLVCLRCGKFPTGRPNRCRVVKEFWTQTP